MKDYSINHINVDKIKMNYIRFGTGKKVLIVILGVSVKPLMQSGEQIAAAFEIFKKDYTVFLFDRRSNIPDGNYNIQDMADEQVQILQTLNIEKADFMGCSQGGMIVQCIALRHPGMVNKIVLAATSSRSNSISNQVVCRWKDAVNSGNIKTLAKQMIEDIYAKTTVQIYKEMLLAQYENVTEEQLRNFIIMLDSLLNFDIKQELSQLKCDAFVIGCEGDCVFSADASREMAEILHCQSFIYDRQYGHGFYDEAPNFRQMVFDFLQS